MSQRKRPSTTSITEFEVLQKHYKFLRDQDQVRKIESRHDEYGERLAKKYQEKLFKKCCIVDLSKYKEGKVGCRWRSKKQVQSEKGQKICAETDCKEKIINSYEMNFGYMEDNKKCNALVKVSLCEECSIKLNYKKNHKLIKQQE